MTALSREQKLQRLGYSLDVPVTQGGLVAPLAVIERTIYASGHVPFDGNKLTSIGKVPTGVGIEEATQAAALCAANILAAVHAQFGDLENVSRVLRITGYVNSDPAFTDQHLVINGASQLVHNVFGDAGRHARTAIGTAQLPLGASVEVEMILQLRHSVDVGNA